jgi:hypothetical protein
MSARHEFFPIWQYRNNISKAIQNDCAISLDEHKQFVSKGFVRRGIKYNPTNLLTTPQANLDKRLIIMPESYLGFLWVSIYFLSMLYERHIIPQQNLKEKVIIDYRDDEPLVRAGLLFEWGCRLRTFHSAWPSGFPPEDGSEFEKKWSKKTYTMWIRASCFIFYHELAHLVLGHKKPQDSQEKIEMEMEADQFAFKAIFPEKISIEQKTETLLGVLSLMIANFFILTNFKGLKPKDHLGLKERVQAVLNFVDFKESEKNQYFYYIAAVGCVLFLKNMGIETKNHIKLRYKTSMDYWNDVCHFIDNS